MLHHAVIEVWGNCHLTSTVVIRGWLPYVNGCHSSKVVIRRRLSDVDSCHSDIYYVCMVRRRAAKLHSCGTW